MRTKNRLIRTMLAAAVALAGLAALAPAAYACHGVIPIPHNGEVCPTRPTAVLTASATSVTTGQTVILNASESSGGDDGADTSYPITHYGWNLDGDADFDEGPNAPTTNISFSTTGTKTVGVEVTSASGTARAEVTITVTDATPPTVALTSPAVSQTQIGQTLFFGATASDASGIRKVEFLLDDAKVGEATSAPYTLNLNTGPYSEGSHTIAARAIDGSGNSATTPSRMITIDKTAPTAVIGTKPPSLTNNINATFSFSSPDGGTSFQCRLLPGGGEWSGTGCDPAGTRYAPGNGQWTFEVRAIDAAGNVGAAATYTWTIDTIPPTATIDTRPPSPTNSQAASFSFSSTDGGTSFECKLAGPGDSQGPEPCNSGTAAYSGLGEGAYTFTVRAIDAAGNRGNIQMYTWTVDRTAPNTALPTSPPDETSSTSATFTYRFVDLESGGSFRCRLDGAATPCAGDGSAAGGLFVAESLAPGTHTFSVAAVDAAGNADPTPASRTWTVKGTPPVTNPAPDTTKPVASLAYSTHKLGRALSKGLAASGKSNEKGTLRLEVVLAGKTAKQLRLTKNTGPLVIAKSATRTLSAPGASKLTAKFTAKAKKALAKLKAVKVTLRLTARDAAGNVSVKNKTVTLKR